MNRLLHNGLLLALALLVATPAMAEVIHKERSVYRNIVVNETDNLLCLAFSVKRTDHNQSCMDLSNRDRLVFSYVRMVFAALLINPNPQRILVVGLGGGSIPVSLHKLYPKAKIDISEVDDAVVRVARDYFDFKQNQQMQVNVSDARVFIKRALLRKQQYDLIILDAFTGDYIPEHLMTVEFLTEVNDLLSPSGVLASNTFSSSQLYHHESVTYQQVFGSFFNFKMSGTGNRVILSTKAINQQTQLPDRETMQARAEILAIVLEPMAVEINDYPLYLSKEVDWETDTRPLTDQYSPANLLKD